MYEKLKNMILDKNSQYQELKNAELILHPNEVWVE